MQVLIMVFEHIIYSVFTILVPMTCQADHSETLLRKTSLVNLGQDFLKTYFTRARSTYS